MKLKNLLRLCILLLVCLIAALSTAQVVPKYETAYGTNNTSFAIVSTPAFTFTDLGKKGFNLPVSAFTGTSNFGVPVAGFKAPVYETKIAGLVQSDGTVHVIRAGIDAAWLSEQGRKNRLVLWFKITY